MLSRRRRPRALRLLSDRGVRVFGSGGGGAIHGQGMSSRVQMSDRRWDDPEYGERGLATAMGVTRRG